MAATVNATPSTSDDPRTFDQSPAQMRRLARLLEMNASALDYAADVEAGAGPADQLAIAEAPNSLRRLMLELLRFRYPNASDDAIVFGLAMIAADALDGGL